ncbi:hypothetical protein DID74_01535 [Candidatus Marinamargulisbacteria bacterium SCGC AG-333-B06]|nr:hypothetical protein DID74_01535 [Candidatus Marinamargulisbacteria bacterium SCGC AG-333-B06]
MQCQTIQCADTISDNKKTLPFFMSSIPAGFPSPADDYMDNRLNINDYVIKNPMSTYYIKVSGDSMIGAGIFSGDILVVDRSIEASHNRIVIAMIDGDFTVKRLRYHKTKIYLISENSQFVPIEVTNQELMIWGVVTFSIHQPV